jgi:hypothetical protein
MRFTLALALLRVLASAFARNQIPLGPTPVRQCVQTAIGEDRGPVRHGTGFTAVSS